MYYAIVMLIWITEKDNYREIEYQLTPKFKDLKSAERVAQSMRLMFKLGDGEFYVSLVDKDDSLVRFSREGFGL